MSAERDFSSKELVATSSAVPAGADADAITSGKSRQKLKNKPKTNAHHVGEVQDNPSSTLLGGRKQGHHGGGASDAPGEAGAAATADQAAAATDVAGKARAASSQTPISYKAIGGRPTLGPELISPRTESYEGTIKKEKKKNVRVEANSIESGGEGGLLNRAPGK